MTPGGTRRRLRGGLAVLAALAVFLGGLLWLGRLALDRVRGLDRYTVAFADIDCPAPPGQKRAGFLEEVQYLAGMPDRLRLLEDGLAERLAAAFGRHPWVETVGRVEVVPPRQVRVELAFRTPVLVVAVSQAAGGALVPGRVVDRQGVLLPRSAPVARGLPVLRGNFPAPAGPPGTPWGDPAVTAAARTAAYLRPYRDRLNTTDVQVTEEGIVLSGPLTRVFWGRPPGAEPAGEASAARKRERLLGFCQSPEGLAGMEYDLRPPDRAVRRPFPKEPDARQP